MLKALRQNPAEYVQGSLEDAVNDIGEVAAFGTSYLTAAEVLQIIKKTENNISAALHFLDIAKTRYSQVKKPAKGRIIHRDVAFRYFRLYGGQTEWVRTDVDDGYVILVDIDGETRGKITQFDKFPKPVEIDETLPF